MRRSSFYLERALPGKLQLDFCSSLRQHTNLGIPRVHFVGHAAAERAVQQVAEKVPVAGARTEILKAAAVLRDRSSKYGLARMGRVLYLRFFGR